MENSITQVKLKSNVNIVNVMEEHNRDIDASSDFKLVEKRNMRRGKPQQQIYKPGSGKLRRSNTSADDNLSESGSTRTIIASSVSRDDPKSKSDINTNIRNNRDPQKRVKKPEQELYVPRPLVQTREVTSPQHQHSYGLESSVYNGSETMNRSKRYSSNRSDSARNDNQNEWRDKSPIVNRNIRLGSEPRALNNGSNWSRDRDHHKERDTRSVEPSGMGNRYQNNEKIQSKPPSGRRHSTVGNYEQEKIRMEKLKALEKLAPRFRKKFMQDNGLTPEDLNWDGSSTLYQQTTVPQNQPVGGYHHMPEVYSTLPHPAQPPYNQNFNSGYHTLPNRPRGRGRLQQEPEFQPGPVFRSVTPDRSSIPRSPVNSRPPTPTRKFDRPPSRSQTPVSYNYNEDQRNYNDYRPMSDRGGKTNVFDRMGGRNSEPRHIDRESFRNRKFDENRPRRDEDNRNRKEEDRRNRRGDENRNRRNEYYQDRRGDGDRTERDRNPRRNDKNRRGRRSSSRDFIRHGSRDSILSHDSAKSNMSHDSNRTIKEERPNARQPGRQTGQNVQNGNATPVSAVKSGVRPSLENQLSPVSPEELPEDKVEKTESGEGEKTILDWNEEVELNNRLEAEAFSDAMTRSSSMASLQEISTRSTPASTSTTPSMKRDRRKGRRKKSKQRSGSSYRDKTPTNDRHRKDSIGTIENRDKDNFRVPQDPPGSRSGGRRRNSRDNRESSFDRFHNKSRNPSRDVSFDRSHSSGVAENWREEIIQSRRNSEREGSILSSRVSSDRSRTNSELEDHPLDTKKAGILVLPKTPPPSQSTYPDRPKFPEIKKTPPHQKTLFDPNNPKKPILVKSPGGRVAIPGFSDDNSEAVPPQMYTTDQFGNLRPNWYDEAREEFRTCHFPELLRDIKKADTELQCIINNGMLLVNYETIDNLRQFLKSALEYLLCKAIKFCQTENVEQHIWKILYYNIIEVTRKAITNDPDNKNQYKGFLLYLIDEGTKYFERLLVALEDSYGFKVVNYIGNNCMVQHKGLGFVGLALVSAQKIFLFLGDLGRYREQVNETSNYGKCRQWYIKSHEINPKNGKPYNQLAVLAVYSRRKLDAVYYYMRSLMSSNPVPSARESLISLFDENRKKYEQGEKKRREERLERQRQHMKQKESEKNGAPNFLRKETWIHPEGGRRLHRTTKALQDDLQDSEEEDLAALSSVDVNKRFVISYLHVHGKLITKIGLESFQDAAMQMLKEFRALLQHSPVPLPCNRFLQLLALNMFAIESTQLKDVHLQQSNVGYRSELQERALIVSLQMFNLILERCVALLQDHSHSFRQQEKPGSPLDVLPHDVNVLLPAIKIWCDWMLCHTSVWNPPPSTQDFKVGHSGDLWIRLGHLMNLLERMDQESMELFSNEPRDDYQSVRLPEDANLCGFTPLMFNDREAAYAPPHFDSEAAQLRLRIAKLLFFGTVYLCGLEPPVLKLELEDGRRDYVSVVNSERGRESPPDEAVLTRNDDVLLETFSGDEEDPEKEGKGSKEVGQSCDASSEVRDLLSRKVELEKRRKSQELHRQRVMKILSQSVVSVHLEIRPKYLVPDTNCFIDHLDSILTVAKNHSYTVMVPIVVLSELEGLSKGGVSPTVRGTSNPDHVQRVAVAARSALDFLKTRHPAVKCVTTKGAVLASTSFSTEDDTTWDATMTNDDKILTTCLVLCKGHGKEQPTQDPIEGEPRHLFRDVVLLTEDRNLRVKAHARDVPVRALPDFMRWAGLG